MKHLIHVIVAIMFMAFGYYVHRERVVDACLNAGGQWSDMPSVCIGIGAAS